MIYHYSGIPYKDTPLNKGHLTTRAGTFLVPFWYFISFNDPTTKDTSIKRTRLLVLMVEAFHVLYMIYMYMYKNIWSIYLQTVSMMHSEDESAG